jgi:site-specific recombinase XerD
VITRNIHELESNAREVFKGLGYAKPSMKAMLNVVRKIIRLHKEQNEEYLNGEMVANYVKSQEIRYQNGEIGREMFFLRKTSTEYLTQIYRTGTIVNKRRKLLPALPDYFERVLTDILANKERNSKANKQQYDQISPFFRWLWERGHDDLSRVDEHIVREYMTDYSSRVSGGSLDIKRRALKELFMFISEDGILSEQMSRLFLFSIPVAKKIRPLMKQDEIAAVLNLIDRSTIRGKRDYAIILLAAVTGLRACDIAELTLDSIDWRSGEIRIIQEKTDKALALPLTTDAGKAIEEYVLNARPHSKHEKIFLSTVAPFGPLHRATLNSNFQNYCIAAGLPSNKSFHSLRRGIATSMVIAGVSVITVAQTLGHRAIDSTKQYISLDSVHLKECALDFSGIEIGGDRQ